LLVTQFDNRPSVAQERRSEFFNSLLGVPGMHDDLGGESPPANLMEVKARETQGHQP